MQSLTERWKSSVILADGAMGTLLFGRQAVTSCVESFNIASPDLVEAAHREYLDAGAALIETNTFAANRVKLSPHELAARAREINAAGVRIARRAAGQRAYVAASVGPLGALLRPIGAVALDEARDVFAEQIDALVAAEPDLLALETFGSVEEALIALSAAKARTRTIPVLVSLSVLEDARTPRGDALLPSFLRLREAGADAVGVNCAVGPQGVFDALAPIMADLDCPVAAMPNAGFPHRVEDRTVYESAPPYFARFARDFVSIGVNVVGGCCGTTPEHIAAMAREVQGAAVRPRRRTAGRPARSAASTATSAGVEPAASLTTFEEKLGRRFAITVEMTPPLAPDPAPLLAAARRIKAAGADAIHIADGGGARPVMSGTSAAALVLRETGLAVILHVSCRDRNLVGLQSELLGAAALGVPAVVALTGDPLNVGDFPKATSVFDVTALGLTRILRALNEGKDQAGSPLGAATRFRIGVAANPLSRDLDGECARLREKMEAGADFAITQPIFAPDAAAPFFERGAALGIPLLVGLLPLRSIAHAEFLDNEVPGMQVPPDLQVRLREAKDEADEGRRIAVELLARFARMRGVAGVCIAAQERYDAAADIIADFARLQAATV